MNYRNWYTGSFVHKCTRLINANQISLLETVCLQCWTQRVFKKPSIYLISHHVRIWHKAILCAWIGTHAWQGQKFLAPSAFPYWGASYSGKAWGGGRLPEVKCYIAKITAWIPQCRLPKHPVRMLGGFWLGVSKEPVPLSGCVSILYTLLFIYPGAWNSVCQPLHLSSCTSGCLNQNMCPTGH